VGIVYGRHRRFQEDHVNPIKRNNAVRRSRPPISAAWSRRDIKLCVVPADRLTLQLSQDYGSGHDIVEKKYD
jgi:hypothetical protein